MGFSNSHAHTFLDIPAAIDSIRELAGRAADADRRILRVVLFGSLATGRATPRSDADLLIVLSDHPSKPIDRIPEYLEVFAAGPMPVDVFPVTEAEMERRLAEGDQFLKRAIDEGIVVYAR